MARPVIRAIDAQRNLDVLLAFAIAGVLGNRFFLVITGYPQLGGGTLHISHHISHHIAQLTGVIDLTVGLLLWGGVRAAMRAEDRRLAAPVAAAASAAGGLE